MVIDTSALIAVMTCEPDAGQYESAIKRDAKRLMSVASILEAAIVLEKRFGEEGPRALDELLRRLPIEAAPFDGDQLEWARYAHHTYGRGPSPGAPQFGGLFSTPPAKTPGQRVYKKKGFSLTEVRSTPVP